MGAEKTIWNFNNKRLALFPASASRACSLLNEDGRGRRATRIPRWRRPTDQHAAAVVEIAAHVRRHDRQAPRQELFVPTTDDDGVQ